MDIIVRLVNISLSGDQPSAFFDVLLHTSGGQNFFLQPEVALDWAMTSSQVRSAVQTGVAQQITAQTGQTVPANARVLILGV